MSSELAQYFAFRKAPSSQSKWYSSFNCHAYFNPLTLSSLRAAFQSNVLHHSPQLAQLLRQTRDQGCAFSNSHKCFSKTGNRLSLQFAYKFGIALIGCAVRNGRFIYSWFPHVHGTAFHSTLRVSLARSRFCSPLLLRFLPKSALAWAQIACVLEYSALQTVTR